VPFVCNKNTYHAGNPYSDTDNNVKESGYCIGAERARRYVLSAESKRKTVRRLRCAVRTFAIASLICCRALILGRCCTPSCWKCKTSNG